MTFIEVRRKTGGHEGGKKRTVSCAQEENNEVVQSAHEDDA